MGRSLVIQNERTSMPKAFFSPFILCTHTYNHSFIYNQSVHICMLLRACKSNSIFSFAWFEIIFLLPSILRMNKGAEKKCEIEKKNDFEFVFCGSKTKKFHFQNLVCALLCIIDLSKECENMWNTEKQLKNLEHPGKRWMRFCGCRVMWR